MRELLSLVESGTGSHIVTWSLDRLSRDRGDCALLVQVFQRHGVTLHSVNDVDLDITTASGRL
jgi:DNA invertase Pin-like site-specific DNA recombinase